MTEGQYRSPIRGVPRTVSLAVVGSVLLSGLAAPDLAAAGPKPPPLTSNVKHMPSVPGTPVKSKPAPAPGESQRNAWTGAADAVWPVAGSGEAELAPEAAPASDTSRTGPRSGAERDGSSSGTPVRAGALPVTVATPAASEGAAGAAVRSADSPAPHGVSPTRVRVGLADRAAAGRAGVDGVLVHVKRSDGASVSTPVSVALDYSAFKGAYGGDWASRLQFVALPQCALTTPELARCRTRAPVLFKNDPKTSKLTARIDASGAAAGPDVPGGSLIRLTAQAQAQAQSQAPPLSPTAGGVLLAAAAAPQGPKGDFKATSLAPSGTWQGGGPAGDFSWSYAMEVPTSLGGPGPSMSMTYSSSSVDGRTSAAQAQASWVGDGWDLGSSYIERMFPQCAADKKAGSGFNNPSTDTGDLCQGPPVVAMSLNGASTQLVLDDATKQWRLQAEDGSRVELLRGAPNGDKEGEYWVVTATDGTTYYFGQNRLPGWSAGKPETKSVWSQPVVGNHPGEDCHQAAFAQSFCTQAYRWHLDLVVDPRGNAMAHYYETETNSYGSNVQSDGTSTNRQYVRGGWLARTEYGLRSDSLYAPAPAQVDFTVAERCIPLAGVDCSPGALTKDTAKNWPDVPFDQNCNAGEDCKDLYAPTFWSRKRLVDVTTRVRAGGQLREVDTWKLTHDFPMAGDGTDRALWLVSIQRTGKNGTTPGITTPAVQFVGKQLPNRVDNNGDGSPPYFRYRIEAIHTETGQTIAVTYAAPECSTVAPVSMPANPEGNGKRCYPAKLEVKNPSDPQAPSSYKLDWFHKHLVTRIRDEDRNGNSPTKITNFEYVGAPAWAFDDDNELSKPELRTWSQWRGYERVRTRVGNPDEGAPSLSETYYFRGMDGDRLPVGTRSVELVDSEGGRIRDTEEFNGQIRETLYYRGDTSALDSATVYTPWLGEATATRARDGIAPQVARVQQTTKVTSRTLLSDGRGWRRTATENTFDRYGLQLTNSDSGDLSTEADDTCTRTTYAPIAAKNMLSLVGRTETVATACNATVLRPQDVIGDRITRYDGSGNFTSGSVLDGYVDGAPRYQTNGSVTVDEYGRPKTVTDIYGVTTTSTYFPAAGEIASRIETVNGHATVTGPALGRKTVVELDPGRGLPLIQTDGNGRRTVTQYDALGRMARAWSPDRDPGTQSPDAEFAYDVRTDGPVVVTTRRLQENGGYSTQYELFDGMLRLRQTQMPAFGGGRVITDNFYNSRGEAWKQNAAYVNRDSGPVPALWSSLDSAVPSSVVTQYDALGRITATIRRANGTEQRRTTTTYGGDWIAVDPPQGTTPTKAYLDALGRKTRLEHFKGDGPAGPADTISYEYDPRGGLAKVTGPDGVAWTYAYDTRGRMTRSVDPDSGESRASYDAGSRVLTTTDGRGRTLAYAYDVLGRPTATHEGTLQGPKLTEYTYDTLPEAVGLPVSSSRFVNGSEYRQEVTGYDTEYRPTGSKITVPAAEGKLAGVYAYTNAYSANTGLPTWVRHPAAGGLASENVTIAYNGSDLPTKMTYGGGATFVDDVAYDAVGRATVTKTGVFGKQVWSTYDYDQQTGRVNSVTNDRETEPQRINRVEYAYDPAGNILKIKDAEGPNAGPAQTDTQCFAYDYMQRMAEAWSATDDCAAQPGAAGTNSGKPQVGGPNPYWTSYTFSVTGNRTSEVQHDPAGDTASDVTRTYTYPQGSKTHQLSSVTTTGKGGSRVENYGYDPSGNTTGRTVMGETQTLEWNSEGGLAKATRTGASTEFVYDASGSRLIRRDPDSTTLYLPGTELKHTKATDKVTATRYYAHPAGPVMVRTNESGTTTSSYLISDHNGTANTSVDRGSQEVSRRKSTPFGDARGAQPSIWPGERGFVGGTEDRSTGLTHLGAREYDPAIGRFISADPIMDNTDPQQMQAYSYANNSPVTLSDPTGLCTEQCLIGKGAFGGPAEQAVKEAYKPPAPPAVTSPAAEDVARAKEIIRGGKMKFALQAAREILKDASGYNDIEACLGGDLKTCGMMAAEALLPFAGKAKKLGKALKKAWEAFDKWGGAISWALDIAEKAEKAASAFAKYAEDLASYNRKYSEDLTAARKADADAAAAAAKQTDEAAAAKKAPDSGGKPDAGNDGASCTVNSFVPGTEVALADGSTKPIEDVQLGDVVLATDPETGVTEAQPVAATIIGQGEKNLVRITVATGPDHRTDTITATDGHPFWVEDLQEWVPAKDLTPGTWLRTSAGTYVQITALQTRTEPHRVHNLTVTDLHTYYVLAGAIPTLVHNCSGGNPAAQADLSQLRQGLGLPAAALDNGKGKSTLARLDHGGVSYYGINGRNARPVAFPGKGNRITATSFEDHAEGDVFSQAMASANRGGVASLYVDRVVCSFCAHSMAGYADALGLDAIMVFDRAGLAGVYTRTRDKYINLR
ncbi:polymorphic toxin-type HINT domain-containing protein [Streptomyces sp. NPDC006450]|uniref:polymorphic toxin-type HINT domain-containing protein n=1 Tax=Streptomyces sp. NPDC006450 TaxID=3155458 RepID=UPI0033A2EE63